MDLVLGEWAEPRPRASQTSTLNGRGLSPPSSANYRTKLEETPMLKGGLLWLIGIPIPIIILLFLFGVL